MRIDDQAALHSQPVPDLPERFLLDWYRENGQHVQILGDGPTLYVVVDGSVNEPQQAATAAQAREIARELENGDTVR